MSDTRAESVLLAGCHGQRAQRVGRVRWKDSRRTEVLRPVTSRVSRQVGALWTSRAPKPPSTQNAFCSPPGSPLSRGRRAPAVPRTRSGSPASPASSAPRRRSPGRGPPRRRAPRRRTEEANSRPPRKPAPGEPVPEHGRVQAPRVYPAALLPALLPAPLPAGFGWSFPGVPILFSIMNPRTSSIVCQKVEKSSGQIRSEMRRKVPSFCGTPSTTFRYGRPFFAVQIWTAYFRALSDPDAESNAHVLTARAGSALR